MMELPPKWLDPFPIVQTLQYLLLDKAKFLTKCGGRGLFYIYQGTLFTGMYDWHKNVAHKNMLCKNFVRVGNVCVTGTKIGFS